jgi:hypothetical protein
MAGIDAPVHQAENPLSRYLFRLPRGHGDFIFS